MGLFSKSPILIAGGTGLIGRALVRYFAFQRRPVIVLTRQQQPDTEDVRYLRWSPEKIANGASMPEALVAAFDDCESIINLAGHPIAAGRLGASHLKKVRESRIDASKALVALYTACQNKPRTWIQSSAIGYYGPTDTPSSETTPAGHTEIAKLCVDWEAAVSPIQAAEHTRLIILRLGIVLSPEGEAWKRMVLPIKLGLGGKLGSGKQFWSWIHIDDVIQSIDHLLNTRTASGPFNIVSPTPMTQYAFTKTIASHYQRPAICHVPAFVLKLILGNFSSEILNSNSVSSTHLQESGYVFQFPKLSHAVVALEE